MKPEKKENKKVGIWDGELSDKHEEKLGKELLNSHKQKVFFSKKENDDKKDDKK